MGRRRGMVGGRRGVGGRRVVSKLSSIFINIDSLNVINYVFNKN